MQHRSATAPPHPRSVRANRPFAGSAAVTKQRGASRSVARRVNPGLDRRKNEGKEKPDLAQLGLGLFFNSFSFF